MSGDKVEVYTDRESISVVETMLTKLKTLYDDDDDAKQYIPYYDKPLETTRKEINNYKSEIYNSYPIEKQNITIANVLVDIFKPKNANGSCTVFIHGGGWVLNGSIIYQDFLQELSTKTGTTIYYIDYDLSPEYKYPIALNHCYDVIKYLYLHPNEFNIDANRINIIGDSAGGNLATVTTMKLLTNTSMRLANQILIYPVTDISTSTISYMEMEHDIMLPKKAMKFFIKSYTDCNKYEDPYISPILFSKDDLVDMPKTLIITGEKDVLRDEGELYGSKIPNAQIIRFKGMFHGFLTDYTVKSLPIYQYAIDIISKYIK